MVLLLRSMYGFPLLRPPAPPPTCGFRSPADDVPPLPPPTYTISPLGPGIQPIRGRPALIYINLTYVLALYAPHRLKVTLPSATKQDRFDGLFSLGFEGGGGRRVEEEETQKKIRALYAAISIHPSSQLASQTNILIADPAPLKKLPIPHPPVLRPVLVAANYLGT